MKHKIIFLSLVLLACQANALGRKGEWIGGAGLGLTVSPTLLLINPQLEYKHNDHLYYGPMIQAGLGDGALFTISGTIRYVLRTQTKIQPSLEGGLGLTVQSRLPYDSLGICLSMGMGFDYPVQPGLTLGTMIRAVLAPPLKTFFLSWPLLVARIAL